VLDLRSGRLRRLKHVRHDYIHAIAWSPDGQELAFVTEYTGLWVVGADGTNRHRIARHVDWNAELAWSASSSSV
jgi:Tol biopolymer transport system component